MRRTHSLVQLAIALMDEPSGRHWGYQLSKDSGVRSGVMYPLLSRMLDEGWLEDGWEELDARDAKRPPRRYYVITDRGRLELGGVLQAAQTDRRFAALPFWSARPAGGWA